MSTMFFFGMIRIYKMENLGNFWLSFKGILLFRAYLMAGTEICMKRLREVSYETKNQTK